MVDRILLIMLGAVCYLAATLLFLPVIVPLYVAMFLFGVHEGVVKRLCEMKTRTARHGA